MILLGANLWLRHGHGYYAIVIFVDASYTTIFYVRDLPTPTPTATSLQRSVVSRKSSSRSRSRSRSRCSSATELSRPLYQ